MDGPRFRNTEVVRLTGAMLASQGDYRDPIWSSKFIHAWTRSPKYKNTGTGFLYVFPAIPEASIFSTPREASSGGHSKVGVWCRPNAFFWIWVFVFQRYGSKVSVSRRRNDMFRKGLRTTGVPLGFGRRPQRRVQK